jgi:hypothetical protein
MQLIGEDFGIRWKMWPARALGGRDGRRSSHRWVAWRMFPSGIWAGTPLGVGWRLVTWLATLEVVAGGTAINDGISKSNLLFMLIYKLSHPYVTGLGLSVCAAAHVVVSGGRDLVAWALGSAIGAGVILLGYQVSVSPAIVGAV